MGLFPPRNAIGDVRSLANVLKAAAPAEMRQKRTLGPRRTADLSKAARLGLTLRENGAARCRAITPALFLPLHLGALRGAARCLRDRSKTAGSASGEGLPLLAPQQREVDNARDSRPSDRGGGPGLL